RSPQLKAVTRCLSRVVAGRAASVFIEGEAGIGKTRLLQEALGAAEGRGLQILSANGEELERSRPFGVLADALGLRVGAPDPERAALASLLRGEAVVSSEDSSATIAVGPNLAYRVVEEIVSLMERLASAAPVVLALEDLHWADPSTLVALHATARRLRDVPWASSAPSGPHHEAPSWRASLRPNSPSEPLT
ncbi:MAG TPA: ATP-binding protein, partial [Acidimicrobiales bacterium]|nr:ATP-binding protein [Acidimicrobiales bacterium]